MKQSLPLKEEYYQDIKNTPKLFDWLNKDIINGIWYINLNQKESCWINSAFWKTLNYPNSKALSKICDWKNLLNKKSIESIESFLDSAKNNSSKSFNKVIEFKDFKNKTITLNTKSLTVKNKGGESKAIVFKFSFSKNESKKELDKLIAVFEKTNEIAKVGGWNVDLVKNKVHWSKVTRNIHEVEKDYMPEISTGIDFYKAGENRERITKLFYNCIENGEPFDDEFKIITAKKREIWVRAFGKSEFKSGKCISVYGAFQDIDTQKKQELAFIQTKERFEMIFNNSAIGIFLISPNNEILMINNAAKSIFELDSVNQSDLSSFSFSDIIHPENFEKAKAYRKKLISGEIDKYKVECRFITGKGNIIWCNINTSIIRSHNGSEDLIITQAEDITELKKLQNDLLENINRFKNVFEYSPNGMGVVTVPGKWIMFNKKLAEIIGYSKEELQNKSFEDITYLEDLDNDKQLLLDLVNKKIDTYSIQKRYVHKKGHLVYCTLNVSALQNKKGEVVSLIGQVVDITSEIESKQALKESLNNLETLLDATTHVSIIETNLNGIATKFNKGAENLLGYKAKEVVGIINVGIFHKMDEIIDKGKEMSKTYNTKIEGFDVFVHKAKLGLHDSNEWTYVRKDGSEFTVQLVVTAVRDSDNEIKGYLGVATDITEIKKMETSLIKAKHKAEEANKAKSYFLANMSHEIRTPLNGVIGFTDLLIKTNLTKKQEKYMKTINNSANILLELVNDILDFSRIEAGKLELNYNKTNLNEICEEAIDTIKHQARSKELKLILNLDIDSNNTIHADKVRLQQILINLLGNATKFTHQGEIELKITSRKKSENSSKKIYDFYVRDTGIGIAKSNVKKIFSEFIQEDVSTTRKYGGTGLGLAISSRLIKLMGGKLQVDSKIGKGSTFSFSLAFKTKKIKSIKIENVESIKNVLVIDHEKNSTTLKDMLQSNNIETTFIPNGIEAIELLKTNNNFDLTIIDYELPYMNGLDLIKHIREELKINKHNLPIVLLHNSVNDIFVTKDTQSLDLDIESVLLKPIQINKLKEVISNLEFNKKQIITEEIDLSKLVFNIMIAEDNPVNKLLSKTIVKKILPLSRIIEASDGQEAVELFDKENIDLILMDIQMPILSGYEATEQIRAKEKEGQQIPIIALTARTIKDESTRCLKHGMNSYISKPVVFDTLKKIIVKYLINNVKNNNYEKLN